MRRRWETLNEYGVTKNSLFFAKYSVFNSSLIIRISYKNFLQHNDVCTYLCVCIVQTSNKCFELKNYSICIHNFLVTNKHTHRISIHSKARALIAPQ